MHRRRLRLNGFDYSSPGGYFVTICTHRREQLFGQCLEGEVRLAPAGLAVFASWLEIPAHSHVELDAFVVMPNHVHGILFLVRAGHAPPLQTMVGSFKSAAAREVNRVRGTPGATVWQRGYHDHIVRGEEDLERIREYIVTNPARWSSDPENV